MKRFLLLGAMFALAPVAVSAHSEPVTQVQVGTFVGEVQATVTLQPSPAPQGGTMEVVEDEARQTPRRDFGDRLRAGLRSIIRTLWRLLLSVFVL